MAGADGAGAEAGAGEAGQSGEGQAAGGDAEEEAEREKTRAFALATLRGVVAEIRAMRGHEENADAIRDAKVRLATVVRAARAAGVPQAALIEASANAAVAERREAAEQGEAGEQGKAGEQGEAAKEQVPGEDLFRVGDLVEVYGLESESGRPLNGRRGAVSELVEDKGRCRVDFGQSIVSIKLENLRRPPPPPPPPANKEEEKWLLKQGDRVEVHGLESESGMKLNGKVGAVVEYLADKGRFKVEFGPDEYVSIKPANLKKQLAADKKRSRSRSRSRSSGSSSSRKRKKEKTNKKPMSPDEVMEMLLTGKKPKSSKKKSKRESSRGFTAEEGDSAQDAWREAEAQRNAETAAAAGAAAGAAAAAAAAGAATGQDAAPAAALKPGDPVEVHGLQSEAGRPLNGRTGIITKFVEDKGRFQVELGLASVQSLKPENLRLFVPGRAPAATFESSYTGSTAGYTLL